MARGFQFALHNVLRIKRQQQQQIELQLSRLRLRLDAVRAELNALEDQFSEAADYVAVLIGNPHNQGFRLTHQHFVDRLRSRIRSAKQSLGEIQCEYDASLRERMGIAKEVESLATLKAARLTDFQKQQNRRSLKLIDEHVMRRWAPNATCGE